MGGGIDLHAFGGSQRGISEVGDNAVLTDTADTVKQKVKPKSLEKWCWSGECAMRMKKLVQWRRDT